MVKSLFSIWNPNSALKIFWDIASMLFIFVQMLLVPIMIAFEIEATPGLNVIL
jgi:hypothetical protein